MKILLTGHQGFVGSHLARALSDHEVSTFEWGDPLPSVAGLDWAIHVGAISSTVERDVERVMRQNVDFTLWLYNECRSNQVNMQWASSASVYGLGQLFQEDADPDPRTPYAWSKYIVERHMRHHPANNIIVQAFRYFNVYGSGEEHKGQQASPFARFAEQAKNGSITVFEGSENYRRDFISVEQVVQYHLRFLQVPESGVFNVGTGQTMSFQEIAESFGVPINEVPMPAALRPSYQTYTCADMSKTLAVLDQHNA